MQKAYPEVLPGSAIGKAIFYSLNRWDKLSLYATSENLNVDNNPVENSLRPVAVGRKIICLPEVTLPQKGLLCFIVY